MEDVVADLARHRSRLSRSSTAERVADILRDNIIEGAFPPGERLSEEAISEGLGVSRNTLRE
ncbi:GntR family transcriptional regulator, partial [Nonomuraea sp. NPDC001023]